MRIFIVAGEPSGDRHAAALVREILVQRPDTTIEAYGMDAVAAAGARVVYDMRELAVMWFFAVVARLPTFVGLIHRTFESWRADPPDVVVLVDYPGLNLLLGRYARRRGIPVVYYIPPQLWAWAPWRRRRLARASSRVLTVLPFEADFLADAGVDATCVGHPLGDEPWQEPAPEPGRVLLMPGSRTAELDAHLELFLAAAGRMAAAEPSARFDLVVARDKHRERIDSAVAASGLDIEVRPAEEGRAAFQRARVAIAKSGTNTLELGIACVPTVIVYRVGRMARWLGRMHMTSPFIGLVNVVAGREVAPELLLSRDEPDDIARRALELMQDGEKRSDVLAALARVRAGIAIPGAAARAATEVIRAAEGP